MGVLGIDIGGSSIKYGLVELDAENPVVTYRNIDQSVSFRNTPDEYCTVLTGIIEENGSSGIVGLTFPSLVEFSRQNFVKSEKSRFYTVWKRLREGFPNLTMVCINDADAAGLAEMAGPYREEIREGTTILVTLGTGIGSALFINGTLVPNTELAYLRMHGMWAEDYTAASVINKEKLTMDEWSGRLHEYLTDLERILNPDHILLGGKISEAFDEYRDKLASIRADIRPAYYGNDAGIIGAAYVAQKQAA